MKNKEQYKLEEYQAAAATLGTTVERLIAQDTLGPMCESGNSIRTCVSHRCPWFIKCYPQYKNTVAKKWLPEGY